MCIATNCLFIIFSVDAKNDDTKASTVQSNDNLENGNRIGEEDQNEKNEKDDSDGTCKCPLHIIWCFAKIHSSISLLIFCILL